MNDAQSTTSPRRLPARTAARRRVLKTLAAMGIGSAVFRRALAAQAEAAGQVTPEMIRQAEWIAGLSLSDEQRQSTARAVQQALGYFEAMRAVDLGYDVPPALVFQADPARQPDGGPVHRDVQLSDDRPSRRPASDDQLALLPVTELSKLIRSRQVSSVELTRLYLERLERFGPPLHCLVTLTDKMALAQAEQADRELASGRYRGPLHGIPWGAKDLIAVPGYPTGWGATPFKDQLLATKATVVRRLEQAGAVLVAKLSLGALAQGDKWYGGMTRNPWNPQQGSSGSSAGSAAAVAAGLVGFALGSETLGSIVSPCRRCGATGLRPTFGRVSRFGCMALAWSMDKIGPIARSVEDCALVLAAIHGRDGLDAAAVSHSFDWPSRRPLRTLRVGYVEGDKPVAERPELEVLRTLGVKLVPIRLPDEYPVQALTIILNTEAAAVFDPLTRQGVAEGIGRWPVAFRQGQFVPAVEYLRANRIRTLLMRQMRQLMRTVDVYVGGDDLALTNLTGHPTVVLPNGFRQRDGITTPTAITLTGRLFGETDLLAVAHAYQQATGYHLRHPPLEQLLPADQNEP